MRTRAALRLVCRPLSWDLAPVEALRLVWPDAHPVALIGNWAGGCDVIGSEPLLARAPPQPLGDVFDAPCSPEAAAGDGTASQPGRWGDLVAGHSDPAFGGGWIGYLGFSAAGEALPPGGPRRLPAWWFGYYDHVVRHDQATGKWLFEALWTADRADALERRFEDLSRRACYPPRPREYSCGDFRLVPAAAGHKAAVGQAVSYIRQGDIFQANICLRLEADFAGDPLDAFCHAVTVLRPPFAAFLRLPGGAVASLSPELFLRRKGTTVVSRPIKGTNHRSPRRQRAAIQRGELKRSAKNRAENVMIVDLVRNDLSRVCAPGSVTVPRLLGVEPHPGVWHLVSEVRGTLSPGRGDGDLIRAAFPPGSVTGAPKVRALEIIDELEAAPREIYTGAVGYRSPVAGLELNVAIRTFEFAGGQVWLGCGGGIVADSSEDEEYTECLLKAGPLIRAIGGRLDSETAAPAETAAAGVMAGPLPRPAAGVFTSLRVTAGETAGLTHHLARLERSTRELYGKGLPESLAGDLADCLSQRPSGRLRIMVRPVGGPLRGDVEVVPLERYPVAVSLRPVVVPGGIGAHKWLDRRLLADLAHSAGLEQGEHLLITDAGGEVLETDRANVFAVSGGVLYTPPADGRILPGVTRDAIVRAARRDGISASVAPVTMALLLAASEVFVSNAVQGVLPVRSVAGSTVSSVPGPVTRHMAELVSSLPASRWVCSPGPGSFGPGSLGPGSLGPGSFEPGSLGAGSLGAGSGGVASQAPPAWAVGRGSRAQAPGLSLPGRPLGQGLPARPLGQSLPAGALAGRRRDRPVAVLIDNYDSFSYNLVHMLAASGCQVEVVRNDEVTAEQVAAFDPAGVLISPGPCGPADAGISVDVVRACAGRTPLLGICLGHQAIAAAFGARIINAPRPVHGQVSDIVHDGRGVLTGLPQPFQATRYHSLAVDEHSLPSSLVVTARTGDLIPMGLRHTAHQVEGVQFHPESILTTHGEQIIRNFVQAARTSKP